MKNQVIKTPTKGKEYFGHTDTDIVISTKGQDDINALVAAKDKSGMLESVTHIPLSGLRGMTYNQHGAGITLKHLKKGKDKNFKITFGDSETRDSVANSLAAVNGFQQSETPESKWKPLLFKLFFVLVAGIVTAGLAGTAYEAANGGEIEHFTGRRSGMKNMAVKAATALGPIGVGVIGGAVIWYMLYSCVQRWKNPAMDIQLS